MLNRTKSVPMEASYGLGNLLLPVMLFYHPLMEELAQKIVSLVEKRKLQDSDIRVSKQSTIVMDL